MASIQDIVNAAAGIQTTISESAISHDATLQQIQSTVTNIHNTLLQNVNGFSQTTARDYINDSRNTAASSHFKQVYDNRTGKKDTFKGQDTGLGGFLDSFEDALIEEFLGSDFKKNIKGIAGDFAKQFGVSIKDIPNAVGKQLGKTAMSAFKQSEIGKKVTARTDEVKNNAMAYLRDKSQAAADKLKDPQSIQKGAESINNFVNQFRGAGNGVKGVKNVAQTILKSGAQGISNGASGLMSGLKDAATSIFAKSGAGVASGTSTAAAASTAAGAASTAGTTAAATQATAALGSMATAAEGAAAASTAAGAASAGVAGAAGTAGTALAGAGAAAAGASAAFPPLAVVVAGVVVAFVAIKKITESVGMAFKALTTMIKALKAAGDRDNASREQNLKLAKQRMEVDYETMVKYPFELLQQAAEALYQTWNSNLATINATQGYTKSDLQDLMSAYASRLRDEGLSSYINGANLTDNLAKVINAGLSGQVAEEFAYLATKLGAAIPTQDFFSYASTYASIAANAVRAGQSQEEAIATANASLEEFASGLLYASRELSGGFSTGLTNASSLYEQSAKIALAAKSSNSSAISSVLLAVQGYVGAVAPDLASSLTDTIYKVLTGGNSSDIVALRSLAGVNASNTEFLKAVANNPQKVFSTLFENLARMYTDSSDAYMEKAEGYAELFGLTSEAFQRIDFSGLADSISRMNMTNASLEENMDLLVQGQTTTTAEQLKAQQINKYMIEEGLAYVIDNEAAQLIQQHMWDEQIARELMESKYAVELKGAAAEALELIKKSVSNILNFLNPFSWFKKIGNAIATANEASAQEADVTQMLELGKVGQGSTKDLYNLTTRNANLNLVDSLVDLMGGVSAYGAAKTATRVWNTLSNGALSIMDGLGNLNSYLESSVANTLGSIAQNKWSSGVSSKYTWGTISKSGAQAATALLSASGSNTRLLQSNLTTVTTTSGTSAASNSAAAVKASVDKMLADDYLVEKYVKAGKSYDEWAASASAFNISDLSKALEDAGYSETDVQGYFQDKETEQAAQAANDIRMHEQLFRETGIQFWKTDFPTDYRDPLFDLIETTNSHLQDIYDEQIHWRDYYTKEWINKGWSLYVSGSGNSGLFNKFYSEFMKYFVNHTYYSSTSGYTYSDVETIQKKSKEQENGDTIYALAEMLTKNLLDLKDPTVQTNALLAQILIVVNAIMNQQNEVAGTTGQSQLLESLSAMALGMTTTAGTVSTAETV